MTDQTIGGVDWSFWLIGALALIWNVMGVINFIVQMDPGALASYPESHRAIIEGRPAWATGAFAVAVFGGAIGCILLLLRKSVAFHMFIASLLGVIIAVAHSLVAAGSMISGPLEFVMIIFLPLVVVGLLVWYSMRARSKGWIR